MEVTSGKKIVFNLKNTKILKSLKRAKESEVSSDDDATTPATAPAPTAGSTSEPTASSLTVSPTASTTSSAAKARIKTKPRHQIETSRTKIIKPELKSKQNQMETSPTTANKKEERRSRSKSMSSTSSSRYDYKAIHDISQNKYYNPYHDKYSHNIKNKNEEQNKAPNDDGAGNAGSTSGPNKTDNAFSNKIGQKNKVSECDAIKKGNHNNYSKLKNSKLKEDEKDDDDVAKQAEGKKNTNKVIIDSVEKAAIANDSKCSTRLNKSKCDSYYNGSASSIARLESMVSVNRISETSRNNNNRNRNNNDIDNNNNNNNDKDDPNRSKGNSKSDTNNYGTNDEDGVFDDSKYYTNSIKYINDDDDILLKYINSSDAKKIWPIMLANIQSMTLSARTISVAYKSQVIEAYNNRRIFMVYGNFSEIRQELLKRRWVEKLPPNRYVKIQELPDYKLLENARHKNVYEITLLSKMVKNIPCFFIWQPRELYDINSDVLPYRNRVRRGECLDFSTKVGLIGCCTHEKWFKMDGLSDLVYPRSYRLGIFKDDRDAFTDDYRRTQCRNLVRFLIDNSDQSEGFVSTNGTVDFSVLQFAISNIEYQLESSDNDEIDYENPDNDINEWKDFTRNCIGIFNKQKLFKGCPFELSRYIDAAQKLLARLDKKHHDYTWDGYKNIWIIKPGFRSCGVGIVLKNSLEDILRYTMINYKSKFVVQKYIERPFLVYKTKFDIRQYVLLVIGAQTIKIWMYKDCYLRFSSQTYNINDLRESIHLTNNTVQKRYRNSPNRDARLPGNNMWSLEQFRNFLVSSKAPEKVWENKIYAGFRQNIIAVILASAEETNFIENSFEIYGCDFMLDEDYNPILIEINSTPDLSSSTEVTARICPMTMTDLVRVIVDVPRNPNAPTGLFEKVFEIPYRNKTDYDPKVGLPVTGKTMILHKPPTPPPTPPSPSAAKSKTNYAIEAPPISEDKQDVEPVQIVQPIQTAEETKATKKHTFSLKAKFSKATNEAAINKTADGSGFKSTPLHVNDEPEPDKCLNRNKIVELSQAVDLGNSIMIGTGTGVQSINDAESIKPTIPVRRSYVRCLLKGLISKLFS